MKVSPFIVRKGLRKKQKIAMRLLNNSFDILCDIIKCKLQSNICPSKYPGNGLSSRFSGPESETDYPSVHPYCNSVTNLTLTQQLPTNELKISFRGKSQL
jgi:hypothetical protein